MLKVIRILTGRVSPRRTTPPSFTTCCSMAVQSQPERQAGSHTQQPMHRNKLWIDCDAGVDDAQGVILALSSATVDLVGISTVCGNVGAKQVAKNVARVLTLANRLDVPFYEGADEPLLGQATDASFFHGLDGLGDVPNAAPSAASISLQPSPGFAIVEMVEAARRYPGELVLVAIGPLTNVALACKLDPTFAQNVGALYVMGGAEVTGNITPTAEYNFYCDPEAAHLVFLKFPLTTVVTWECTVNHAVPWAAVDAWDQMTTPIAQFITAISKKSLDYERARVPKPEGWIACDPLAVAIAVEHGIKEGRIMIGSRMVTCRVQLANGPNRGQSVFRAADEERSGPLVRLVTDVNVPGFAQLLRDSMA